MGVTYGPVEAEPYRWPYDGVTDPRTTALMNTDWQVDFCGPGGYVDAMGLLLTDCTGATDYGNYQAAPKMITMQGGVFGGIGHSSALLRALDGGGR